MQHTLFQLEAQEKYALEDVKALFIPHRVPNSEALQRQGSSTENNFQGVSQ